MNKGILSGIGAYALWGFFPIYWKFLHDVPALQVIGHRIGWSFLLLIAIILLSRQWNEFRSVALIPKVIGMYSVAAVLLSQRNISRNFLWIVSPNIQSPLHARRQYRLLHIASIDIPHAPL